MHYLDFKPKSILSKGVYNI